MQDRNRNAKKPSRKHYESKFNNVKPNPMQISPYNARVEQVVRAFVEGTQFIAEVHPQYGNPEQLYDEVYRTEQDQVRIGTYSSVFQEVTLHPAVISACAMLGVRASAILQAITEVRNADTGEDVLRLYELPAFAKFAVSVPIEVVYVAVQDVLSGHRA